MLIDIQGISKKYGENYALSKLDLKIPTGSIYGLLGPNGAGKTTLIRMLTQITAPDTGVIYFDGEILSQKHIRQIGYLPEERGLYKKMKVGEQVLYLAQLKGLSKTEALTKLKYWFEKFDIIEWWDKRITELSKGMAQKVQFIITVLHEPKLLIFDEPFSGFDPINANLIKDEILELRKKGATILFSTHRMESVEELCEYVALIDKSKLILDGKLSDIKNSYKEHVYELVLGTEEHIELPNTFEIVEKTGNKNLIKISPDSSSRELLQKVLQYTDIHSFREILPSVNDIFVRAVSK